MIIFFPSETFDRFYIYNITSCTQFKSQYRCLYVVYPTVWFKMASGNVTVKRTVDEKLNLPHKPDKILIFSGKRKSGKDYITDELFKRYFINFSYNFQSFLVQIRVHLNI